MIKTIDTAEGREIANHLVAVCDVAVLKEIDILAAEELLDATSGVSK